MYLSMLFVCSQKSPVDIAIKAAEKDSRQNISFSPRKSLPVFLRALMINRFLETFAQRHPGMQVIVYFETEDVEQRTFDSASFALSCDGVIFRVASKGMMFNLLQYNFIF